MSPIHHVSFSVTNVANSADWYQKLLGKAQVLERQGEGWTRIRLDWPTGLVISLTQHDETQIKDQFSHLRVGLDHISLICKNADEVRNWHSKLSELEFEHGPLEDVAYGCAVTARDPDGIPIEFFCAK